MNGFPFPWRSETILVMLALAQATGPAWSQNLSPAEEGIARRLEYQRFDTEPAWEARHNRLVPEPPPLTRQDFGYSATHHAGGEPGEIGGWVSRSAAPAWYAKPIAPKRSVTLSSLPESLP